MIIEDVTDLKEWMPDKSIYTYWGKDPSKTERNPELLFEKEKKPTKSFHLGISVKDLDKVIGDLWVYLIENDRMASVAIRISKKYHGKGYGTEALSALCHRCFRRSLQCRELRVPPAGTDEDLYHRFSGGRKLRGISESGEESQSF